MRRFRRELFGVHPFPHNGDFPVRDSGDERRFLLQRFLDPGLASGTARILLPVVLAESNRGAEIQRRMVWRVVEQKHQSVAGTQAFDQMAQDSLRAPRPREKIAWLRP